ncbi:hypothetical protein QBC42DRAFT_301954 [Cladorrhinum samala]|uniref:DUF7726 domain-containing protein n=1 Tax=Cladorrhinum samala TaxID=585594 RepID=A0AAV9H7T5_9PEZI|nr:hypothetical protein QBC42DRAFT_301954 [Cladorrhinum samala]
MPTRSSTKRASSDRAKESSIDPKPFPPIRGRTGRRSISPTPLPSIQNVPPTSLKSRKRKSDCDLSASQTTTTSNPPSKKSKSSKSSKSSSAGSNTTAGPGTTSTSRPSTSGPDLLDVSSVSLGPPAPIPVHDTCNEVRRKIRQLLSRPGVTQAAFLRAISSCTGRDPQITSKSLRAFLERRRTRPAALDGNTNAAYYASYVFFEKQRIRDGRPKTKHRRRMEEEWPEGGVPLDKPMDRVHVICRRGESVSVNQWGKIEIIKR